MFSDLQTHLQQMEQHKSWKLLQLLDDSLYIGAIEPLNCWQWGYRLRQWIAIVMGVGAACVFLCAGWSCVSVHQVLRQRVGRWLCNSLEYEGCSVFSCWAAWLRMHPAQWEGQHKGTDAASEMKASERVWLYIVSMPIILHVKQSTAAASWEEMEGMDILALKR